MNWPRLPKARQLRCCRALSPNASKCLGSRSSHTDGLQLSQGCLHMGQDRPANCFAKPYRDRITNQSADWSNVNGATICHKRIVLWKGLQERPFPQGDGAILRWMSKASVAESVELGGNRWGLSVPLHSPVYTRISTSALPRVASRSQGAIPSRAMFLQASSYVCGQGSFVTAPLDLCSGSEEAAAPASRPSKCWMVSLTVTNLASE